LLGDALDKFLTSNYMI